MDLRFDWYSELETDVLDPLVDQIVNLIEKDRSTRGQTKESLERVRSDEQRTAKQLLTALYGGYFVIPKGTVRVSVPKTASHYSGSSINYSYRVVIRVLGALESLGWIEQEIGVEVKGITRIWSVNQLSMHFDAIGMRWFPQAPKSPEELIVLRDFKNPEGKTKKERGKKIDLPTPETDEINQYRSSLYNYNKFLTQHCIALELDDDQLVGLAQAMAERAEEEKKNKVWSTDEEERVGYIDLSRIQLRRIFSRGSITKGGRFYNGWWQSIPSLYRQHITIDGKKTCEVDYSSMSLRIIYAQRGVQIPVEEDLYDIGLSDWTGTDDPRRKPIKTFINAILNDEIGNYKLSASDQQKVGVSRSELLKRVLKRHESISDLFSTGIGLETQFIDSQIAEKVMHKMIDEGIVVLPIHDSFIVRAGYEQWVSTVMKDAFYEVTGMHGNVDADGPKLKEHFGMSKEELERFKNDPSAGIISMSDISFDDIMKDQKMIMSNYVNSWNLWMHENG